MNLEDLSFEITQGVVDGELNINSSGILNGIIHTINEYDKSKVKVTTKDGQTTDIEIIWELDAPKLTVSGIDDAYGEGFGDIFNGTYEIISIDSSGIEGSMFSDGDAIQPKSITINAISQVDGKSEIESIFFHFAGRTPLFPRDFK